MGRWSVANDLHCPKCDRSDLCADDFYWRKEQGKRRVDCKSCFIKQKKANYAAKAAEKCANQRRYYQENKEHYQEYAIMHVHEVRAAEAGTGGAFTPEEWQDTIRLFNGKCAYCDQEKKLTVDHVVPISRGGRNVIENIVPCCQQCNSSKWNKLLHEWRPDFVLPQRKRSAA